MKCLAVLAVVVFLLICVQGLGNRAMGDVAYDTICSLLRGKFYVPVKERSKEQKAAVVRFWRNKEHYSLNEDGKLLFDDKLIARESDMKNIVCHAFDQTKGAGPRKLQKHLSQAYSGISENTLKKQLDTSEKYQMLSARFQNKVAIRPIRAKEVHARHQIDLVDMNKMRTSFEGKEYRYILSVCDVFSRFVWLKPLIGKSSAEIANHLQKIYREHGTPKIIQHDQGKEFKGSVKKLLRRMNVKIIQSSPYHPQSQGKIERLHRQFRKKINYDLLSMKRTGVNWVKQLDKYASILNDEGKEELAWRSPFEIYFGRQNNKLSPELSSRASSLLKERTRSSHSYEPRSKDYADFEARRKKRREAAAAATHRVDERTIKRTSKGSTARYKEMETVLIRYKDKKHKVPKGYSILLGRVVKCDYDRFRYKVRYMPPKQAEYVEEWFSVVDLTSKTKKREAQKQAKSHSTEKNPHNKWYIPMDTNDRLQAITSQGFAVHLNPIGNGNCQFAAMADQLQRIGIFRSAETLRHDIVSDLELNRNTGDGTPLALFVDGNDLDRYLQDMRQDGTYGDHITLQRCADIFNVQFAVISTLGEEAIQIVSPSGDYE